MREGDKSNIWMDDNALVMACIMFYTSSEAACQPKISRR